MSKHETPLAGLRRKDTVSSTPKGLDFVRGTIAKALYPDIPGQAERYADERWGENSRAAMITKAAVVGLGSGTDGGLAMISSEAGSSEFLDLVRAQSIIGRLN